MTALVMVTASGEEHGCIKTVANSVKDDGFKHMDGENKAKAEKLRKDESRKVKARYLNSRGMHERLTKPYCRWAGDPIQTWNFIPGHEYEVPYGLIKEVNESFLAERSKIDGDNTNIYKVQGKDRIHSFVPVGF